MPHVSTAPQEFAGSFRIFVLALLVTHICSRSMIAQVIPVHTQHNPHMSIGMVAYGAVRSQTVADWLNARYDWLIGSGVIRLNQAYPDKTWWPEYADMTAVYAEEMYGVQDIAAANNFVLERLMLHTRIDMTVTPGLEWNESERFDFFEPRVQGSRVGGILTFNGSTYSDETDTSWCGAAGVTVSNTLYVGYMEPFDQMNFTIKTARVGGSIAYQYWNGAGWATLPLLSDGTNGLATNGKVYFYPPSGWARTSVNGSKVKYWVRVVVSGASTSPVYLRLLGDVWTVASGSNNLRGWSTTSPSRLNIGTRLEYNPTPPANATARFPYQARVSGGWVPNSMFGNPSDIQSGMHSWGKYLSDWTIKNLPAGGDSVMYDNGGGYPGQIASPANYMDYFDFNQSNTWQADATAMYGQMVNDLHNHYGVPIPGRRGFQVGTNGWIGPGDWALCEGWWCQHNAYAPLPNYKLDQSYDAVAPANNPAGKKLITTCMDNVSALTPVDNIGYNSWHYFDRSNRSPLLCLAMHLIGWNPNTVLNYNTNGYYYYTSDEVNLFAPATIIANSIAVDTTNSKKTITLGYASGCDSSLNNKVRIGTKDSGDTVTGSLSGNVLTTTDYIYHSYPAGNTAYCIQAQHQSAIPTPSNSQVYNWVNYFPAMGVDIGTPDTNGYRGGERATSEAGNTPWKRAGAPDYISGLPVSGCSGGQCSDVWRRDFTGGIVLFRPFHGGYGYVETEVDTPSKPLDLNGTYYPLRSDGTTGSAISSIQLRAAESAILLRTPRVGNPNNGASNAAPSADKVTPASGSGSSQIIAFSFTDTNGVIDIASAQMNIAGSMTRSSACYVYYDRASASLRLADDAGVWSSTSLTIGGSGTLSNSQCTISGTGAATTISGNTLTVSIPYIFRSGYRGRQNIYALVSDTGSLSSAWRQLGTYTVTAAVVNDVPVVESATSSSGTASSQVVQVTLSDPAGYGNIFSAEIIISPFLVGRGVCYIYYDRNGSAVYLRNDVGTGWSAALRLGTAGTLSNGQCTIIGVGSSQSSSGNSITLKLALSFAVGYTYPPAFGALPHDIFVRVFNLAGATSGWQSRGTYTVRRGSDVAPSAVSVAPNGTRVVPGANVSLTFTLSDPDGYGDFANVLGIVNTSLAASNSCFFYFDRRANQLYLAGDDGKWQADPITLGATGSVSNSQCSVQAGGSSYIGTGNNIALTLVMRFASVRANYIWLSADDNGGKTSGWQQVGTLTVANGVN